MTGNSEKWEPQERLLWQPKTSREEREALGNAPLATLRATPATPPAFTLMSDLAERYPRPQGAKGKAYARHKTLVDYANGVRTAWLEAGLIEHKAGYPGMLAFGNPGPKSGKLTRYRATPQLLTLCAEHGITPEDVTEHFQFEYEMPTELVQLTSPFRRTPTTPRTGKLRSEVA